MFIESKQLRRCLGHFATGVTVVTCAGDGMPHGATVNAFSAVSLEPPLVVVSVDRRSKVSGYLADQPFTVNVLSAQQDDIAFHFAGRPMGCKPDWEPSRDGLAPKLRGALATISCAPWRHYDGGDHLLYLGQVREVEVCHADPLLFYGGAFHRLGPVNDAVPWLESGDCPGISWFDNTDESIIFTQGSSR